MHAPASGPVDGPTLIRLLSRVSGRRPVAPAMAPAARLGEWIDWPRAVALSRVLDAAPAEGPAQGPAAAEALAVECGELRTGLAAEIDRGPKAGPESAGFAPFKQHLQAMRGAMLSASGRLRGELRDCLAAGTPTQVRLAEVDAQMEAALGPREAALLADVPDVLEARFEQLRGSGAGDDAAVGAAGSAGAAAWLTVFRHELRDLLLAELDLRFQPLEGLLAALRSP